MTEQKTPTKAQALEALSEVQNHTDDGWKAYDTVRRFIEQTGAVPEGWQLVPVEPTREMLLAQIAEPLRDLVPGHEAEEEVLGYERETYRSMLAAAPKQEADHD